VPKRKEEEEELVSPNGKHPGKQASCAADFTNIRTTLLAIDFLAYLIP